MPETTPNNTLDKKDISACKKEVCRQVLLIEKGIYDWAYLNSIGIYKGLLNTNQKYPQ